jgi:hypothetical protein
MAFLTKVQLDSIVDLNIADNNQRLVTEPKVRTVMKAIIQRMFEIPVWKIGVAPGPLVLDANYNLNYALSPIVLRKPGGGVELFMNIIDAIYVANYGDLIEVNANIVLGLGGAITLKNGVNIDFRYHSITANDLGNIFGVVASDVNCSVYNIDRITHNYIGQTTEYGSSMEMSVLACIGDNCQIKILANQIITNRSGIVNVQNCVGSCVEIVADKIVINNDGVKDEASFYAASSAIGQWGREQTYLNRIELKANVIDSGSEILFTAMHNSLIRVDVRFVKIQGGGLLLSIGRGIVEFMDMHAISDSFCLIRDKDWDISTNVGLVSFSGKNFLQCMGINGAYVAHSVITLYGRFTLIENYGALRIEQKNASVITEGAIKLDIALFSFFGIPYPFGYSQVVNAGTMLFNCPLANQLYYFIKGNAANTQVNNYLM